MDTGSPGFDWNRARAFLAVAEAGSLSAAARRLGATQPTLGRQIAALERELDVVLFERVGRGLLLTPAGADLVAHVRTMADAADALALAATGRAESLDGAVCVTASEVWAAYMLPPVIAAFRQTHPGVSIEIVASNDLSDLRRREADIAVRSVAPSDPDLIGRKVGDGRAGLYAAQAYLARVGPIGAPEDFRRCDFIGFRDNQAFLEGLVGRGLPLGDHNFPVTSANHLVQWELVRAGAGIGVMLTEIGDAEPIVRPAAPWFEPFVFPIWLVAHRELRTSRRVRLVFDRLAEEFGSFLRRTFE